MWRSSARRPWPEYAFIFLALGFFAGDPWWAVLIATAITFGVIFAYFWLLVRFLGQGAVFWLILVGGLLAPALVRMALAG